MTDTKKKALAYACECAGRTIYHYDKMGDDLPLKASITAHARAIEAHEAFKREVSDAAEAAIDIAVKASYACERGPAILEILSRFILPPPVDPLVEAIEELDNGRPWTTVEDYSRDLRAALAARGHEVRKIEGDA